MIEEKEEKQEAKFTVEKVPSDFGNGPGRGIRKYQEYINSVQSLKPDEAVVIRGLDKIKLWDIQSNIVGHRKDIKLAVGSKSRLESDNTYTLYLFYKKLEEPND